LVRTLRVIEELRGVRADDEFTDELSAWVEEVLKE
jgi:hypothetical protein